jgi:transcriptional regulator with XRE-family HTH domain
MLFVDLHSKIDVYVLLISFKTMDGFSGNLKQLRTRKGFSQDAFAKKIGIHVTNLSKYERNLSIPSLEIAYRMANILEISLDKLVYGENKAQTTLDDTDLLTLFNKAQKLSEKQKETVKDFLSAFVLKADLTQKLVQ